MSNPEIDEDLQGEAGWLRSIFNQPAVGIAQAAPDGHLLRVNRKYLDIIDYTYEELGTLSIDGITYPDDRKHSTEHYRRLLDRDAETFSLEKRYIRRDGSIIWVSETGSMVFDTAGNPEFVIVFAEDITSRKSAEESLLFSEAACKALFSESPAMIVKLDAEFTMLSVNPRCAANLGYAVDELEGLPVLKLFHEDDRDALADQLHKCLQSPYHVYTWQFRKIRKNGELLWVEEIAQAVHDMQGALDILVVCQDITERKRAEEALRDAHAELERSNRELEQFAYAASHDLREPLRMISSYIQLLDRKYRGRLDENADIYINFAVDGTKRMESLIEGILNYSRIRAVNLGWVDTSVTFADVTANLATAIREIRAEIVSDKLPVVRGDATLLLQLFQNLVSNAIRYRKPDVPPRVRVSAKQLEREWLFSIRDNGIGIEPGNFDRVFQLFQRLHTREEYPGTGIGLASCKKIVEQHHGRIWLESSPGEGSTFFFTIPSGVQQAVEKHRGTQRA